MGCALLNELFRDGIGGQKGAQAHQFNCRRVLSFDVLKGQGPGGGNGVRMVGEEPTPSVEQGCPLLLIEGQVVGQAFLGFLQIGTGLIQGKGKPVHGMHDRAGQRAICCRGAVEEGIVSDDACTSQQERGPFFWSQRVQLDLASEPTHGLGAGGQQNVTLVLLREIVLDHGQVVGIVEDQQPAAVRLKPVVQRLNHELLLLGVLLRKVEQSCQGNEV